MISVFSLVRKRNALQSNPMFSGECKSNCPPVKRIWGPLSVMLIVTCKISVYVLNRYGLSIQVDIDLVSRWKKYEPLRLGRARALFPTTWHRYFVLEIAITLLLKRGFDWILIVENSSFFLQRQFFWIHLC